MGTLIKEEVYKQFHKRGWLIAACIMVLGEIGFGLLGKAQPTWFSARSLAASDYVAGGLVLFIAIASTASIVSMEYQYGTMKQILYRQYYRSQVFVAKVITVLLQLAFLQVLASGTNVVLTLILHPGFDWGGNAANGEVFWQTYLKSLGGSMLQYILLLSVVLLLSTLFKSNAAAIATGLVGYFLITIAASLLMLAIEQYHFLKWNPFTFLLAGSQILNPGMAQSTYMSTETMIAGSLVYSVIFGFIAYLSFRKRSI